jgi:outer membrane protein
MKTKLLLAAGIAAATPFILPITASAQRTAPAVVVTVDVSRVGRECTACVAATAALRAQAQTLQTTQNTLGTPLQTEQTAIQTEAQRIRGLPAGAARTAAENALNARAQAWETNRQNAQNQVTQMERNLQSTQQNVSLQLNQRLQPIFAQVATAHGANLVMSTDALLYNAPSVDVTNEVLAAVNQQVQAFSVTPLPQQAAPTGVPSAPQPRPTGR